ncbi:MAG TPA: class I SAM-dependent methyltransferase [Geopsychrobacteraceae bacterium]|nr:class I SAM-dependent methyltransferase [Geopsychrobacteraceae bacterium]
MQVVQEQIALHCPENGESRRLFHGRGHCFEGYDDLVIDYFHPVIMVILYRQRAEDWLQGLCRLLENELPGHQAIYLQERFRAGSPGRLLSGSLPGFVDAEEAGLRFRLRLGDAQNIGFFPDMAVGRRIVRERAGGKAVLNLFSYTCSFSVAALAGGATQVVNLDMNRGALELGRLNHQLNDLDLRKASFLPQELFRSFGKLRKLGPFDLIICDPPATQGKSFTAERHWQKLVRKLPELLKEGGEVFACLNAPHLPSSFLDDLFCVVNSGFSHINSFTPGGDFPEAVPDRGVFMSLYRFD